MNAAAAASSEASIGAALAAARAAIPGDEARLLLRHALGCSAAYLAAHCDDPLPAPAAARFADWVERRAAGEPIAYLTGVREFYGRDFAVSPEVLIPRPETELLVELGIAKWRATAPRQAARLLDLGTGSGCVAVSLALALPEAAVVAVDVSAAALSLAQQNAAHHGARLNCVASDWFAALDARPFDLIVANPPYIAAADAHLQQGDLRFEPRRALASGADGLEAMRRIVGAAQAHLAPGAWLLFEHGYDQAAAAHSLLQQAGFVAIEQHRDLAGIVRVSGGRSALPPQR